MNKQQIITGLAPVVAFVAGILAGKGIWFDETTWLAILSAMVTACATVWAAFTTRNSAQIETAMNSDPGKVMDEAIRNDRSAAISAVADMSMVKGVVLDRSATGVNGVNELTPNNVTVG